MEIVAFIMKNARWFLLAAGLLGGSMFAWNAYQFVKTSSQNEIRIEQLNADKLVLSGIIDDQNRLLVLQKNITSIANETISKRDIDIEVLHMKYDNITQDLGDGLNDQAPEAIKELLRRIVK